MGSNKIFDDIRLMLIGDQNESHQKYSPAKWVQNESRQKEAVGN